MQYKFLLNHSSHKINLISNSPNTFIYGVEILDNDKKLFFYEWHVQKAIDYIKAGGKIDAIKAKYQLTSEQEQKLTTL